MNVRKQHVDASMRSRMHVYHYNMHGLKVEEVCQEMQSCQECHADAVHTMQLRMRDV